MLSPQRAVAAASGGAGEAPIFPGPAPWPVRRPPDYSSEENARPHRRPFLVPGLGPCTPRWGNLGPRIRGRGLLARPGR